MDKILVNGLMAKEPENAPAWVKMKLSIKLKDFAIFVKEHQDGEWMNIIINESKAGKLYAVLDTWKADSKKSETKDNSLPF